MANPRGRQPVGFNQPPGGGTNYPFVRPSADIQYLLGDFFLSYEDFADVIVPPLRIQWMYGFGTNLVPAPAGYPSPAHTLDLIVVDANDEVVADTTTATSFNTEVWDNRLLIIEWARSGDWVVRCTQHTEWTQADIDAGLAITYDDYIEPTDGELQADTYYKLPKRVKSILVGVSSYSGTRLVLEEGYNVSLAEAEDIAGLDVAGLNALTNARSLVEGSRRSTVINISSSPGDGLGVLKTCDESELAIKTINKIGGDDHQNFNFDAEGCIRYKRPVAITSSSPREAGYLNPNALALNNDCVNCCDCEYFARTYQGIKRQWFLWGDIAKTAEEARDAFQLNIDRWEEQRLRRIQQSVRVRIAMDGNCKVSWGLAHCNSSTCCLINVRARITFLYYVDGALEVPTEAGYDCEQVEIDGAAQCNGPEPIFASAFDENGRYFDYDWSYADPQNITTLQGRVCFPDCQNVEPDRLKIRMHVVIYWDSSNPDPTSGEDCSYPILGSSDYDADVLATWVSLGLSVPTEGRSQAISPSLSVDPTNPYCLRCGCVEPGNSV